LYTRSGDTGSTIAPLVGRVSKSHPCVEAVGALDEAESSLGLAEAVARERGEDRVADMLSWLQELVFRVGFQLWELMKPERHRRRCIGPEVVEKIEKLIDELNVEFRGFTLHGGDVVSASIGLARAAVRRAERRLVACLEEVGVGGEEAKTLLSVLNRMSDLLYALEVSVARERGGLRLVEC